MKEKLQHLTAFAGLCVFAAVLASSGCAAKYASLKDLGTARVEILPSDDHDARISFADVYQENGELVVKGTVTKSGPIFVSYKGHIDVAVVSPGGEQVRFGTAECSRFPSRQRQTSFKVRFPMVAEKGTVVHLVFHRLDKSSSKHTAAMKLLKAQGVKASR